MPPFQNYFPTKQLKILKNYFFSPSTFQVGTAISSFPAHPWTPNGNAPLTRATRYSSWKRNFITIATSRAGAGSKSRTRSSSRSARLKYGFKIGAWNTKRITSYQIRKTWGERINKRQFQIIPRPKPLPRQIRIRR